jgi:hypothetical protein
MTVSGHSGAKGANFAKVENESDRAHSAAGQCQSAWLTSSADHLIG